MSNPTTEQDQAPAAETVDPKEWVGREVDWDSRKWEVVGADFALSYLPRRDGQPGKAPYKRVLELELESLDTPTEDAEAERETAKVYACVLCDFLGRSARSVASHQKVEHVNADASERPSRAHFPADFRDMTIEELREMHRGYQGMADRLASAAEVIADERAKTRAAEKGLATIRRIIGGVEQKPAADS